MRKLKCAAAALIAFLTTAACSSGGSNSNYEQFFQIMRQSIGGYFGNSRVTRDQAAAIPYASLGYRVNAGNENMLILATDAGGEQLWTSSSHVVIVTYNGRIVRTVGLRSDIASLSPKNGSPLPPPSAAIRAPFDSTRTEDFPEAGLYDVTVSCRAVARAREQIKVLDQPIPTVRIEEFCRSQSPAWSFVDIYWVDPGSSLVWRSRQNIGPKYHDRVETEILRPPA